MYQIVIRLIAPEVKAYNFTFGSIVDGQFVPADFSILPIEVKDLIDSSELLNSLAYITPEHIADLANLLLSAGASFGLYPNFIVFTLPEGYVTEKEKE